MKRHLKIDSQFPICWRCCVGTDRCLSISSTFYAEEWWERWTVCGLNEMLSTCRWHTGWLRRQQY